MTKPVFDIARERNVTERIGRLNPLRRGAPRSLRNWPTWRRSSPRTKRVMRTGRRLQWMGGCRARTR